MGGIDLPWLVANRQPGRTHQVRVHLEYLGYPIAGDKLYSDQGRAYLEFLKEGWTVESLKRLRLDRQALHAKVMIFEWKGKVIEAHSLFPNELKSLCIA